MILIVGLGNPGERYEKTRHNIGFSVVDELAKKLLSVKESVWEEKRKFTAQILAVPDQDIVLVKPLTMMNASGLSVAKLKSFYKVTLKDIWVVHDDLDLPLGKIKIVLGHGSAGHHGIDSLVASLGSTEFVRFRVGIGHPLRTGELASDKAGRHNIIDFVLESFKGKDATEASKIIKKTVHAIEASLEDGLEKATNQYNSR